MGCIMAEMAHVWEGSATESEDGRILFKGDSCCPYSPAPDRPKEKISSQDQLIKILEVIDMNNVQFLQGHGANYAEHIKK
jgi:hypothetical protein